MGARDNCCFAAADIVVDANVLIRGEASSWPAHVGLSRSEVDGESVAVTLAGISNAEQREMSLPDIQAKHETRRASGKIINHKHLLNRSLAGCCFWMAAKSVNGNCVMNYER